jgi:2',3'-cyclic-nucleotide 2'-phosphodiesterase (5'-nucleotidase family)
MYPNLAGRYSAFSGIGFTWDCSQKPGERILVDTIRIHNEPIDLNRVYKVAVHSFAAQGGDGYECLKHCDRISNDNDKLNRQLVHDLLHINHYLLDSYIPKYPDRFTIIEKDGHKYL